MLLYTGPHHIAHSIQSRNFISRLLTL